MKEQSLNRYVSLDITVFTRNVEIVLNKIFQLKVGLTEVYRLKKVDSYGDFIILYRPKRS
jgi:hypothetical protein